MASLEPITVNVELNVKLRHGTWCRATILKESPLDGKTYVRLKEYGGSQCSISIEDVEWRPVGDSEEEIEVRVDRVKHLNPPAVPVFVGGSIFLVSGDLLREGA